MHPSSPGDVLLLAAVADGVRALRSLCLRVCPGQGFPPVHTSLQRLQTHREENCDGGVLPGWPKQRTNGTGNTQSKILGVFCHIFIQFVACTNASFSAASGIVVSSGFFEVDQFTASVSRNTENTTAAGAEDVIQNLDFRGGKHQTT